MEIPMLKMFVTVATFILVAATASAEVHPLFAGASASDWTKKSEQQWAKYMQVGGELVRVDYVITPDGPGYTIRRDCGDGSLSFGVIRPNAKVGFSRACNNKVDYTFDLAATVSQAGLPVTE